MSASWILAFNGAVLLALTPFYLRLGDCITAISSKLDIELLGYFFVRILNAEAWNQNSGHTLFSRWLDAKARHNAQVVVCEEIVSGAIVDTAEDVAVVATRRAKPPVASLNF